MITLFWMFFVRLCNMNKSIMSTEYWTDTYDKISVSQDPGYKLSGITALKVELL